MNIRQAQEKDVDNLYFLLEEVQALHADGRPDIFKAGTNKYDREAIRKILSNESTPVYVAVDEFDQAIGYAFCAIKEEKGSENLRAIKNFYIEDLCVNKNLRGKGIGKSLYEYALSVAKKIGCYHLTLNVWHLNQNAVKFYEKLGMQPLKTTMEKIL
ncbi:MAG: GNAT family N-acetyltransferase [Clostridia bacterium]|nr:GNAT family N-acetyltransferase [Clostridia bacterium]